MRLSWFGVPSSAALPAWKAIRQDAITIRRLSVAGWRGGIKGGVVHGATDELGFHAVENRHYVTDLHATVLHQLGLDPRRLTVPGHKRIEIDYGQRIAEIIA